MNGVLTANRCEDGFYHLMFSPNGRGQMNPRSFQSRAALEEFLKNEIKLNSSVQNDLMDQLDSQGNGSVPEVWLTDEQRTALGLL
jgi:hypothetical protein